MMQRLHTGIKFVSFDGGTTCILQPTQIVVITTCHAQVRLLNIGELRRDAIGALTFGAEIPPYKDGMLPSSPKLRYAYPTAPTWQVIVIIYHLTLAQVVCSVPLSKTSLLMCVHSLGGIQAACAHLIAPAGSEPQRALLPLSSLRSGICELGSGMLFQRSSQRCSISCQAYEHITG